MSKSLLKFFLGLLTIILILTPQFVLTQEKVKDGADPEKVQKLEKQVTQLISFLEYSFNTLGSAETPVKDKETIIQNSYKKLFASDEVQVEDDLDEGREAIVNKDVQAYLKDIDFFFRNVSFRFNINSIHSSYNESGQLFFTVDLDRYLKAYTVEGDTLDNTQQRFIEINYDDLNQDLKIASIYTTKLNENEEISYWWKNLSPAWKSVFGWKVSINDTLPLHDIYSFSDSLIVTAKKVLSIKKTSTILPTDSNTVVIGKTDTSYRLIFDSIPYNTNAIFFRVKKIMELTDVNVEGNSNIFSLKPLAQLRSLKRLDCSRTNVDDLTPIRNLSQLEYLDCSYTRVNDLSPLRFSDKLRDLNIGYTPINNIELLSQLTNLQKINLDSTVINDLSPLTGLESVSDLRFRKSRVDNLLPLSGLAKLNILDFSETNISNLQPISKLNNLQRLYCSSTNISDLSVLSGLQSLQTLNIDNTPVSTLEPLSGMPSLEKVYCDNTAITGKMANMFMSENPEVLVIYESNALIYWWNTVPIDWQLVFSSYIELSPDPTKEQLHEIANLTSINVEHNGRISDIEPLRILEKLEELNISYTLVSDLEPLSDLIDLKVLNCKHTRIQEITPLEDLINLETLNISETEVSSIAPLAKLKNLQILNLDETSVQSLEPLEGITAIRMIYCDKTPIDLIQVVPFYEIHPECLVVFQSATLKSWWSRINDSWNAIFRQYVSFNKEPGREDLHRISNLREIDISNNTTINTLAPLRYLVRLNTLKAAGTRITDIDPIRYLEKLNHLDVSGNPLQSLDPLTNLKNLTFLSMVSVPIEDLNPIRNLTKIQNLNISGMPIKDLDMLSGMKQLEKLYFNNTRVRKFNGIEEITSLRYIECFNTRISERRLEKFRQLHPGVDVVYY